jgi:hypothetical protein
VEDSRCEMNGKAKGMFGKSQILHKELVESHFLFHLPNKEQLLPFKFL